MNQFFDTGFTWVEFFAIGLFLTGMYFLLNIAKSLLDRFNLLGALQERVLAGLNYLLLVFEPVAILILSGVFIFVAPRFNGLIILLLLVLGGNYFKHYISGRYINRDTSLQKGKPIAINDIEGVIYEIERFGMQLQTESGRYFISYSKMLSDGYTILGGDESGGILHLKLTFRKDKKQINHKEYLTDLLVSTPYLNRIQKPVLETIEGNPEQIHAQISLRESGLFSDLRTLLNDWGYSCEVFKSNQP